MTHIIEIGYTTNNSGFSEVYELELKDKEEFKVQFKEKFGYIYRKQHMCLLILVDSCECWESAPHLDSFEKAFNDLWEIVSEEWAEELSS